MSLDYAVLRLIWWAVLGVVLIGFAVADGFDMGVAAIFRFTARGEEERRAMLESIEPVWEGNQVWFVVAGAGTFAAWPLLYAASFSGLYLAMFLLLVSLILRPVGFNFRHKLTAPAWRNVWDWALFITGTVPPLLFGVAFGNLFLGLPFHYDELQRPVYTGTFLGLLHPFALLTGVVSLAMLTMHGAAYAAAKTGEPMSVRAAGIGRLAALVFMAAFLLAGLWLALGIDGAHITAGAPHGGPSNPLGKTVVLLRGGWFDNFRHDPALWLAPFMALAAAASCAWLLSARDRGLSAFLASGIAAAGTILTAGLALFPFLLPSSTDPGHGLTVWDASSSAKTLGVMLLATLVLLPIVILYTSWVYGILRGRVTLEAIREHTGLY
jgi:cytochrome bd ubiquinol oxidase subunit II